MGLLWALMYLDQFITLIVMLNLLIAIINETFEKVNELGLPYMYQQRACIIAQT